LSSEEGKFLLTFSNLGALTKINDPHFTGKFGTENWQKKIFQTESDIVKFAFFSIKCKETEPVKGSLTPECNFCS